MFQGLQSTKNERCPKWATLPNILTPHDKGQLGATGIVFDGHCYYLYCSSSRAYTQVSTELQQYSCLLIYYIGAPFLIALPRQSQDVILPVRSKSNSTVPHHHIAPAPSDALGTSYTKSNHPARTAHRVHLKLEFGTTNQQTLRRAHRFLPGDVLESMDRT